MSDSKFDKQDRAILELLQKNVALSVAEIAEKVGISKSACWRRIQKFDRSGVIRDRVALLNQQEINLPLTAYISVRTNQHNDQWYGEFSELIEDLPEIMEVYRMSGDLDYLIKAVVTDMRGYDRLYKKLVKVAFFDVSSSFVMETMKHSTRLPLDYMLDGNT